MMTYGAIGSFGNQRPTYHSNLPQYRPECVLELDRMEGVNSWEDVLRVGQTTGLTQGGTTVEALVAFNGLPPGSTFEGNEYIDACVDGREHGFVGFYGDFDPGLPHISDYVATPTAITGDSSFNAPQGLTETPTPTALPVITPLPTDVTVTDSTLQVTDKPDQDGYDCQYRSTYKLLTTVNDSLTDGSIFRKLECSDTRLEGEYHVTNAHCVSSTVNMFDQRYDLIDPVTHRSHASYELFNLNGDELDVVGGVFSRSHDIAVLYTNPIHLGSQQEACLHFGDETTVPSLSPVQLMNYENHATEPEVFKARLLGQDPGNRDQYLLIDGIDPSVKPDQTSRKGTLWKGGSGGSVASIDSAEYIGTTSAIMYRTGDYYDGIAHTFNISPNAFVRIGIMQPASAITELILDPYPDGVLINDEGK
jgi:hypothetical protein